MRKNIVFVALMSFIFVLSLQIAEPVAAMKMVDHGSIKGTDPDIGYYKFSWFTYQTGTNYVKIKTYAYRGSMDYTYKMTYTIKKISKTKLKITGSANGETFTTYDYSKLTAARYYWRVVRPGFSSGFL